MKEKKAAVFLDRDGTLIEDRGYIGDHPSDAATGDAVGACGLYLLTGHGSHHVDELPEGRLVFKNLSAATEWILHHSD